MSKAALSVYEEIRTTGSQKGVIDIMQSRAELYEYLDYHAFEEKLDNIFSREDE
jgi:methylisocitrate lyase